MRRGAAAGLLLVAALAGCDAKGPSQEDRPDRPNLLIYVVDTLRRDALGIYAEAAPPTPHLDAIGREGVVFDQATSASSWTRASVASLLTGLAPPAHGTVGRGHALPPDVPTLAERLREHGYATGFVTSNPNVGSFFGFARGFDALVELYGRRAPGYVGVDELVTRSDDVTRAALAWLDAADRPWALVVLSIDPHSPYTPPPELDRFAPPGAASDVDGSPASLQRRDLDAAQRARIRSLYDAEVAFTDRSFGALVDGLRQRQELDDTLVVVTSDHGEEFWERGIRGHGASLSEAAIRIPLLVRFPASPRVAAGTRRDDPVGLVDLAPTVLDLLGLPPDAGLTGRPLFANAEAGAAPAFSSLALEGRQLAAAREGRWKLVRDLASGERALYDLRTDPLERQPVPPGTGGGAQAARERLAAVIAERLAEQRAQPDRTAPLPADVESTLRALGYLDDEVDEGHP